VLLARFGLHSLLKLGEDKEEQSSNKIPQVIFIRFCSFLNPYAGSVFAFHVSQKKQIKRRLQGKAAFCESIQNFANNFHFFFVQKNTKAFFIVSHN
jgi:hypothetical protein